MSDRLAFTLMDMVAWWDRGVWMRRRRETRLVWHWSSPFQQFIPMWSVKHDGWRPARYV